MESNDNGANPEVQIRSLISAGTLLAEARQEKEKRSFWATTGS
jgi:hypothetical protein